MIGLSRQYRDKSNEYFEFSTTTTSSPQTISLGLFKNSSYINSNSYFTVDWGDGATGIMNGSVTNSHTYSTAGTYNIKIWTREKSRNFSNIEIGTGQDISNLDLSFSKTLNGISLPFSGNVTGFKLPTETIDMKYIQLSAPFTNFTLDTSTMDLSVWPIISYLFRITGTDNVTKILLPVTNAGICGSFTWHGNTIEAIGPNANVPGNKSVDLTNMNIANTLRVTTTNSASVYDTLTIPASAFHSSGITQFFVQGNNCTSVDLSKIKWSSTNSNMSFYFIANPNCTSVQFATSPVSVSGRFSTIAFYGNNIQDTVFDISAYELGAGSTLYVNNSGTSNTGIETIILKSSTNTTIGTFYASNSSIKTINLTAVPNFSHINNGLYDFSNNSMTAAEVNTILKDIDSVAVSGYTGRSIGLSGNAAPDTTSGGFDGVAAKASLLTKGFTITTA